MDMTHCYILATPGHPIYYLLIYHSTFEQNVETLKVKSYANSFQTPFSCEPSNRLNVLIHFRN